MTGPARSATNSRALVLAHLAGEPVDRLPAMLITMMGPHQVLLGNLNPVTELVTSTPAEIERRLSERHREAGARRVVGAGCEIPAAAPPENVDALVAFARATRP